MGYDLVDVFMDVDFYCTKSNGKQVGLSWATGYANHYKSDDTSYTYGFDVDNERDLDFENITLEIKSFYATGHTVYSEKKILVLVVFLFELLSTHNLNCFSFHLP